MRHDAVILATTFALGMLLSACTMATQADSPDDASHEDDFEVEEGDDVCQPTCENIGTRAEGWYDGCSGDLLGWASCSDCVAECRHEGSRSEGWYDSCGVGLVSDPFGLIQWAACN